MKVIPYLIFDGNAEEALNFYKDAFEADDLYLSLYEEGQGFEVPENYLKKVMHGSLLFGDNVIYACDNFPDRTTTHGNNISLNLSIDSKEELEKVFENLSKGGKVVQPLKDQFWGATFGSLDDKYGIHWSLNYQKEEN